jgi:hypothetical protein
MNHNSRYFVISGCTFLRVILFCFLFTATIYHPDLMAQPVVDAMTVLSPDESISYSRFGIAVDLSGDWLIVGDYYGSEYYRGYVNMYHFDGSQWRMYDKLNSDVPNDRYGTAVAIDGNRAIVGAYETWFDEYGLPRDEKVKLILYDMLGRKVKTVVDKAQKAGHYSVRINNRELNLASGLYFYRIQAGNFMQTRKMLLIK